MFFQLPPTHKIVRDFDVAAKGEHASEYILKLVLIILLLISNSFSYSEVKRPWITNPSKTTQKQLIRAAEVLDNGKGYKELLDIANKVVQETMPEISNWFTKLEFKTPKLANNKKEVKLNRAPCLDDLGYYTVENKTLNMDPFKISSIHSQFLNIEPEKKKLEILHEFYGEKSKTKDCKKKSKKIKDSELIKPILESGASGTMAHELFHAVQAGDDGFRTFMIEAAAHNWIIESTADAVERAWLNTQKGDYAVSIREYDYPLYKAKSDGYDYATALFWLYLGKKIGSPHKVKYLDDLLTGNFEDKETGNHYFHGLEIIDSKLSTFGVDEETKSLYRFYPVFIAERVDKEKYYEDIQKASISHSGGKKAETIYKDGIVDSIAAQATLLKVNVPAGFQGELEIKFKDNDKDDYENLHLSVDTSLYNQDGDSRNEASISTPTGESEYLIRVANIAKKVSETKTKKYELEITLRTFEFCKKSRQSGPEKVGAPKLSDVKPGKGDLVITGSVSGKGTVCSDVVTGVPSFNSGALGTMTMSGKIASFLLYSPVTPQIEFKGNHMFPFPKHGGTGGWKPNSRYEVAVKIDGVEWKQIKKGKTYPATVRAMVWEWQGDVTEYINKYGQKINLLTGSRTQNFPMGKLLNGSIKILDKGRLKNGAIMIKAEITGIEKFPKNTFTTSSTIATTRDDGYQYEKNNGFTNKDTIIVKSTAIIYCDAYFCKKRRKKIKK